MTPALIAGPRAALVEWRALRYGLEEVDYRVPCRSAPSLWTSDTPSPDEIAYAEAHCRRCPVRAECAAYADAAKERGAVWGGRYRSTKPAQQRRSA